MAVPAWLRIWDLVKFTISAAMSVSRMRDSDAERFSTATPRLLTVCSRRFCTAPNWLRCDDTVEMAKSIDASAEAAAEAVEIDKPLMLRPDVVMALTDTEILSLAALVLPTWKVKALVPL